MPVVRVYLVTAIVFSMVILGVSDLQARRGRSANNTATYVQPQAPKCCDAFVGIEHSEAKELWGEDFAQENEQQALTTTVNKVMLAEPSKAPYVPETTAEDDEDPRIDTIGFGEGGTLDEVDLEAIVSDLQAKVDPILNEELDGVEITVEDAIYYALKGNENLQTTYISRETDKASLRAAEDEFRLQGQVSLSALRWSRTHSRDSLHRTDVSLPSGSLSLTQRLKTGGQINFAWGNTYNYTKESAGPFNATTSTSSSLNFTQPLLQGAGCDIPTLALTGAYISEESNIQNLKGAVIDTVTGTIIAYRDYYREIQSFDINKRQVFRERESLQRTQLLVEAGRIARTDLVERRRALASTEFELISSKNALDERRLALLRIMNIDTDANIIPNGLKFVRLTESDLPTSERAMAILYQNSPSYINQLLGQRQAELSYLQAKDALEWELNFDAGITTSASDNSLSQSNRRAMEWRDRTLSAGLTLNIPVLNGASREQGLISAKVAVRNSQITLKQVEQDLTKQVIDQLRNIRNNLIQLKLAQVELAMAKLRLQQKNVELDAGKVTQFELTNAEDTYRDAEFRELGTQISYMNALASFDSLLGTTLDTWGISVCDRTSAMPELNLTLFAKNKDAHLHDFDPQPY